jgi:HEAT repeat protein
MDRGRLIILCAGFGALAGLGSCAPAATEGGFDAANPAAKLYAIQRAGLREDRSKIPQLIEQLDSDDPAVRLFAIEALERMTGERRGYKPYDPPHRRAEAVDRWVQAHRPADPPDSADGSDPDGAAAARAADHADGANAAASKEIATP